MKITLAIGSAPGRRNQSGVAVIVMLALLSLILIYITANIRSLNSLQKEIQRIEQRQVRHWNTLRSPTASVVATNSVTLTNQPPSTVIKP